MTLAVVALWPWGRLRASRVPGLTGAVVLAADTRISFSGGRDPDDTGLKLYMPAPSMGLVFSGRVRTAQRAINDISSYISQSRRRDPQAKILTNELVAEVLKAAHERQQNPRLRDRQHWNRKSSEDHLYVLCGGVAGGQTFGMSFSSETEPKFKPTPFRNVKCIGDEAGFDLFYRCLKGTQDLRWKGQRLPVRPDDWTWDADVASAILNVIEEQGRPTIGGKVQAITIWPDHVIERSWMIVKQGSDPLRAEDWDKVTIPRSDLKPGR
jgi:hypothetical protein